MIQVGQKNMEMEIFHSRSQEGKKMLTTILILANILVLIHLVCELKRHIERFDDLEKLIAEHEKFTCDLVDDLENTIIGYSDESTCN